MMVRLGSQINSYMGDGRDPGMHSGESNFPDNGSEEPFGFHE